MPWIVQTELLTVLLCDGAAGMSNAYVRAPKADDAHRRKPSMRMECKNSPLASTSFLFLMRMISVLHLSRKPTEVRYHSDPLALRPTSLQPLRSSPKPPRRGLRKSTSRRDTNLMRIQTRLSQFIMHNLKHWHSSKSLQRTSLTIPPRQSWR